MSAPGDQLTADIVANLEAIPDFPTVGQTIDIQDQRAIHAIAEAIIANQQAIILSEEDNSASTGSNAVVPSPTAAITHFKNNALVSVQEIVAVLPGNFKIFTNNTDSAVVFKNLAGTAANQIVTGTGSDLSLDVGASFLAYYGSNNKWNVVGGSGGGGGGAVWGSITGTLTDQADLVAALGAIQTIIEDHIADTNNPHAVTKAQVGLGNVDNTSDVDKPVSTLQAAAIAVVQSDIDVHEANTSNPHSVTKAQVGLGNVDNTSDASKPVSTLQAAAIAVVQSDVDVHEADMANPHNTTKTQVGLGNVDNTSDVSKPISTLQQAAIDGLQSQIYESIIAQFLSDANSNFENSIGTWATFNSNPGNTINVDTTGDTVTVNAAFGGYVGMAFVYTTTGTPIGGLVSGTTYYIQVLPNPAAFGLCASPGGALINLTSVGTGTHTFKAAEPGLANAGTSSNLTLTRNTTTPLLGTGDLSFAKGAANAAGESASVASRTIGRGLAGQQLSCAFIYDCSNANYATGDLAYYLADMTNNEPIPIISGNSQLLPKGSGIEYFIATPKPNCVSVRLIVYVKSTNALAYTCYFDNFKLGVGQLININPNTKPVQYSPVIGSTGSAPTQGAGATKIVSWFRRGRMMVLDLLYFQTSAGTNGTGDYLIPLPGNGAYVIDTNFATVGTSANGGDTSILGHGRASSTLVQGGTTVRPAQVYGYNTTNLRVMTVDTSGNAFSWGASFALGGTIYINFRAEIPIVGWDESGVQALALNSSLAYCVASKPSGNTGGTGAIPGLTLAAGDDSHNGLNVTTGQYTVKVAGDYDLEGFMIMNVASATILIIAVNGTGVSYSSGGTGNALFQSASAFVRNLKVGDVIDLRTNNGSAIALVGLRFTVAQRPFSNVGLYQQAIDLGTQVWADNQANATTSVKVTKFGNIVKAHGVTVFTGAATTEMMVTIPGAYAIKQLEYPLTNTKIWELGDAMMNDSGTQNYNGKCYVDSIFGYSGIRMLVMNSSITYVVNSAVSAAVPMTWANGDSITWDAEWIVEGW